MASDIKTVFVVDTQGLNCPFPVLRAKKAIRDIAVGEAFELVTTDPLSSVDVRAWVLSQGHKLLAASDNEMPYRFWIQRVS